MNSNASRCVPNWFETCCAATASTVALIWLVDMLGSKTFTLGPKSGVAAAAAASCAAAPAPPPRRQSRRPSGEAGARCALLWDGRRRAHRRGNPSCGSPLPGERCGHAVRQEQTEAPWYGTGYPIGNFCRLPHEIALRLQPTAPPGGSARDESEVLVDDVAERCAPRPAIEVLQEELHPRPTPAVRWPVPRPAPAGPGPRRARG